MVKLLNGGRGILWMLQVLSDMRAATRSLMAHRAEADMLPMLAYRCAMTSPVAFGLFIKMHGDAFKPEQLDVLHQALWEVQHAGS